MEDDEGVGAGNAGDGAAGDGKPDVGQQMELLTKTVGLLAQGLQELQGNQSKFTEALEGFSKTNVQPPRAEEPKADPFDGADLDTMTNKDLVQLLLTKLSGAMEEKIAKTAEHIDSKVSALAERFEGKNASEQIEKVAGKNDDFWEWASEIKLLLKDTPTLSVDRAYKLARAENPDKVEKLKSKYEKKVETKSNLFSLTPTSSRQSGTGKMSQRDAAEKAFNEVMSVLDQGKVA